MSAGRQEDRAAPGSTPPVKIACCDGPRLRRALLAAADPVSAHRGERDRINVFPVADGDTGTNLTLTMPSVADAARPLQTPSVGEVARAARRGAGPAGGRDPRTVVPRRGGDRPGGPSGGAAGSVGHAPPPPRRPRRAPSPRPTGGAWTGARSRCWGSSSAARCPEPCDLLGLRPVLTLDPEGNVVPHGRTRGEAGRRGSPVEVLCQPLTAVMAAHLGAGAWGICYQVED